MSGSDTRRDFLAGRALLRLANRSLPSHVEQTPPAAGATVRLETHAMACPWSVVLNPGPPEHVMAASDALDLVHPIEQLLSIYREDSLVAQLRSLASDELRPLPAELFGLLHQCQLIAKQTQGAFDPTAGPVIRLWRECRQVGRIPEQSEITEALQRCGLNRVLELDAAHQSVRVVVPQIEVDLGAIGKGYAIDRISEALQQDPRCILACTNSPQPHRASFLVHGGFSSLRASGPHNGHAGWPIGLRNPLFPDRNYATMVLKDRALATSGSNVQFFRHQGQRYGHILDPCTGWPVEGMLSVTVTAPTATEADALSTAFYVMGLEPAAEYCRSHPEIGAILVPPQSEGRTLTPRILNIPEEELFFGDDVAVEND